MAIFDTHAHILDEAFDEDRQELLRSFPGQGMAGMIEIGCGIEWAKKAVQLTRDYPYIYAAAGIHPQDASEAKEGYLEELHELLETEKVVALGEIGLDYHYEYSPREIQLKVFEEQLNLAKETDMPVCIHMRSASEDTLRLLKKYKGLRGVMHCYSGSLETAKECLKLGYYISFSGSVTFKNAVNLQPVAAAVPEDRIMAETDCPYLSPEPYRGRRNDPSKVKYVLEKLAQIRGIDFEEMCAINMKNAKELFGI